MNLWEQFNQIFSKGTGRPSGNFYRMLLLLILVGSGLLWLGSWFTPDRQDAPAAFEPKAGEDTGPPQEQDIVEALTEMIGQIKGVSNVKIFVTMDSGNRLELVTDGEKMSRQTLERDSGDGSREVIEQNNRENHVVLKDSQGREYPLVIQEFRPRYRGVLVVAEGVENPEVKLQVIEALKAVLNLSYHRITVLPRGD